MNRPHVRRLVTGLVATATTATLGALVACGGGAHPSAATDEPIVGDSGPKINPGAGTVVYDIDLQKGIVFGDNGRVPCGTQASDQTITLKNTSTSIVNFQVSLTAGNTFYKVTPTDGGIPAGGTATLKISPTPIPADSDVQEDQYAGTLEIRLPGLGVPPQTIRLHQTAAGAIITSSAGASLNLGSVKVGESNSVPISLTNKGNMEATASFKLGTDVFTINDSSEASVKLVAGASESRTLKLAPKESGDLTDSLAITYNSAAVFCKVPPSTIELTGKGTTSVGISKGSLDFGLVNCGSTAVPQSTDISSTIAMKFTAVLTKGALSPFTLANDQDGSVVNPDDKIDVPSASSFKLRVIPKPMESVSSTADNAFGDTLTITTDVPGDTPHTINLRQGAKGAVLSFDLASLNVSGPVGGNINTNFNLRNTGNLTVPYKITASPAPDPTLGGFTSTLTSGTAILGNTAGVLISKAPTAKGSITNGTLKVELGAGGGILCADLPPPVPLAVTGTGTAITINPNNLNYGTLICDSTPEPQFFTLTATVENNIKLSLGGGPASPFAFFEDKEGTKSIPNNSSVNVKPGSPTTVWVHGKTISVPPPASLNDEITLISDIATEDTRKIPLTMAAAGAKWTLPTTPIEEGKPFTITNSGAYSGKLTISGPATPTGLQDLPASASLVITTTGPGTVTITPAAGSGACVTTGTVTVNAK